MCGISSFSVLCMFSRNSSTFRYRKLALIGTPYVLDDSHGAGIWEGFQYFSGLLVPL